MKTLTPLELIKSALAEDLPNGDVTTDSLKLDSKPGRARLLAKEDLVLSGHELFAQTFQVLNEQVNCKWQFKDGDFIWQGQTVCVVTGPLGAILRGERVALNFLGHLSGIASLTRCFAEKIEHTGCRLLDTRKTTPLFRELEKKAVRDGKGVNHRFNLSEAVLIKDNHIKAVGGVSEAIRIVRQMTDLPIEVECATLSEVDEAVQAQVSRILLDNMNDEMLKTALGKIPARIETEVSGNITLERIQRVAEMGAKFVSVGAITHSAPTADFSLEFE